MRSWRGLEKSMEVVNWGTGSVKAKLVSVLKELVAEHQERRSKVTDEVIKKFMTNRSCV